MKKLSWLVWSALAFLCLPAGVEAAPTVFPTGTTIYKPDKCWNGWTVLSNVVVGEKRRHRGVPRYSMNGDLMHVWKNAAGFPPTVLPGGKLLTGMQTAPFGRGIQNDKVVEMDFDGNIVWSVESPYKETRTDPATGKEVQVSTWLQHHNLVRWPQTAGYYAPGSDPDPDGDTMFGAYAPEPGKPRLFNMENVVIVDHDGKVKWRWSAEDVVSEELSTRGRRNPDGTPSLGGNSMGWLGPNPWYDKGDARFHPKNILMNNYNDLLYIIDHETGKVVWQLGPDYSRYPQLQKLGLHINGPSWSFGGQNGGMIHNVHMIPKGLPGAGNILLFNNGGNYSLVTEFNPVTMQVVWEYYGRAIGYAESHSLAHYFFSPAISNAQRLPNGNTLITEGDGGRVFEVTPDCETVWEFINPDYSWPGLDSSIKNPRMTNMVYRAYRIPYEYVPQLKVPDQHPVVPTDNAEFRIAASRDVTPYDRKAQDVVKPFPAQHLGDAADLLTQNPRDAEDEDDMSYNTMELKNY